MLSLRAAAGWMLVGSATSTVSSRPSGPVTRVAATMTLAPSAAGRSPTNSVWTWPTPGNGSSAIIGALRRGAADQATTSPLSSSTWRIRGSMASPPAGRATRGGWLSRSWLSVRSVLTDVVYAVAVSAVVVARHTTTARMARTTPTIVTEPAMMRLRTPSRPNMGLSLWAQRQRELEKVGPNSRSRRSAATARAGEGTRTLNHLFTRQVRYRLRHSSRPPPGQVARPRTLPAPAQSLAVLANCANLARDSSSTYTIDCPSGEVPRPPLPTNCATWVGSIR